MSEEKETKPVVKLLNLTRQRDEAISSLQFYKETRNDAMINELSRKLDEINEAIWEAEKEIRG